MDREYAFSQGKKAGKSFVAGISWDAETVKRQFEIWKALQAHHERYPLQVAYSEGVQAAMDEAANHENHLEPDENCEARKVARRCAEICDEFHNADFGSRDAADKIREEFGL